MDKTTKASVYCRYIHNFFSFTPQTMTNHEIWEAVLAEFELTLSKANFTTWFRNTGISEIDAGMVTVCVPNTFTKSWLEKKYHSELVKTIERLTSKPVKRIEYIVKSIKTLEEKECNFQRPEPARQFHQQPKQSAQQTLASSIVSKFGLNAKYSFEHFIVGKNNELAHAAAQAVASRPGETYNPLFIYGGVGLGKTHLLQAIANEMLKTNPKLQVLYVSSEKFTNEFVASVKEGRAKEFKDRYRNVDLLLIDDIQFIGGKEQTQEEFFHTFNELHQQGKQVVLTSDRPPKAIPSLEDRLRSRFEWGMIADISSADLETRTAILQLKCQERNFTLAPDIIDLIAITIQSNIRELEGALNKVMAYHQLKKITPTKETVKATLSTFEERGLKKLLTPKELILLVSKFYGLELEDILGKSREKRLSFPRQIAMHLLRAELKLSYPAIGQELGGRDHTTAMHAHSKITKALEVDPKLREEVALIKQQAQSRV